MTPDATEVSTRRVKDVVIVELPASFTSEAEKSLNQKIEWEMADTPGGVVLDFSRVTATDDAGMKSLKWLFTRTDEIDVPVVMAGVRDSIRGILEKAGYLRMAEVADSVDDAVEMI